MRARSFLGSFASYDPSKESIWTRLGLSLESYKRAPGVTGGQVRSARLSALTLQVISGSGNLGEDLEQKMKDSPLLQPKMKPRHLQVRRSVAELADRPDDRRRRLDRHG